MSPARTSVFSLAPVQAAAPPNTPMIAVPWVPLKWESRPVMTSAAIRPWRFAGPASGTWIDAPVTWSRTSMASPTAKMSGTLVRIWSSTRIPPRSPMAMPAVFASPISGRTPMPITTMSAGMASPDSVSTSSDEPEACLIAVTCRSSMTLTPLRVTCRST